MTNNSDHLAPWNPPDPVEVTPTEYEEQIASWLRATGGAFRDFRVTHQAKLVGSSGEYAFDALAEFEIFHGAKVLVLIECKRHTDPVKRDDLLTLEAKLRDVGAHKAIVFSTAGFQSGAITYAAARGIATITFIDGKHTYVTRSTDGPRDPPPWANVPRFAGWRVTSKEGTVGASLVSDRYPEALKEWLFGGRGAAG